MCGIAGILRFDGRPIEKSELQTMLNRLAHRGRDHSGMAFFSQTALGHRRLSIIDLDEAAAQPMYYAGEDLCVTLNGEIYNYLELRDFLTKKNYVFKTRSDTEILLAAYHYWGPQCLRHLNGMFAFALWDERQKKLFCARDQLGIKPFYYLRAPGCFAFASESLALSHLHSSSLNEDAVLGYLLSMYVATNESIFAGIRKLPPGHSLTLDLEGKMQCERYWSVACPGDSDADATNLESMSELIKRAVHRQVRSDVPIGGFLSGGIDSGLITALAAPHVSHYHTYSAGYEGMPENELPFAQQLAERYGTIHTQLTITARDAMTNLNEALLRMSEPVADPAMAATYMLSGLAAQDGVKVLLNGTGGDELFAGYTRYTGQLSLKRRLLLQMPLTIKRALGALPIADKFRARLRHENLDMLFSTGGSYALASRVSRNKNYLAAFLRKLNDEFQIPAVQPLLYQQMFFDLRVYLPDELLFLLDQMTMAHTIEGRVPLLDINIVNAAFQFKAAAHIHGGQTKAVLKKVALPYLGTAHTHRKKQGFAGSSTWWVRQNREEFLSVIAELRNISYFEKLSVDRYHKAKVLSGKLANEMFILYCFGKWHERLKANPVIASLALAMTGPLL